MLNKTLNSLLAFVTAFVLSMGLVCGVASSQSSAPIQTDPFPQELKGYEFFGKGKLKNVVFGLTKKVDIEKIFGTACEKDCEYDERFWIKFDYITCDDCMTTTYIRDRAMCPMKEYIGTIEKITLTPRVPIQFDNVPTAPFPRHSGGTISFKDGSGGVSYESFADDTGLKYSIKQGSTASVRITSPAPRVMSGPLYAIEYGLSVPIETRIFKAEYKSCIQASTR